MNELTRRVDTDITELTDDIDIIGPGRMLQEAREALKLSQQDVAQRLNFRLTLVKDIEDERFDKSLPDTFNRGYLRNFAKLVNVCEKDIIASYEMLDIAEIQCAEMQSFSKITKKQAENSRIMWLSYLILALILGSTLVWFFQDTEALLPPSTSNAMQNNSLDSNTVNNATELANANAAKIENNSLTSTLTANEELVQKEEILLTTQLPETTLLNNSIVNEKESSQTIAENSFNQPPAEVVPEASAVVESNDASLINNIVPVTFSFSGDCWVNIYDATGERIAWGVKKTDYIMKIKGVAPFTVTLGKPELVTIDFNGDEIDMTQFNIGNIAKFTLPIVVN